MALLTCTHTRRHTHTRTHAHTHTHTHTHPQLWHIREMSVTAHTALAYKRDVHHCCCCCSNAFFSTRELRAMGPACCYCLGEQKHQGVRRRRGQHHSLWAVSRICQCELPGTHPTPPAHTPHTPAGITGDPARRDIIPQSYTT